MPPKPKPSRSDWENGKETIRQLYLDQDFTRQEVQRRMEKRGLIATKAQYEAKFKEWGFSKNVPVTIWKHVGFKIEKRKREGKDSTVSINGIAVPLKKVKREISRHYYSLIERAGVEKNNAPSPQGPLTLVSTPPSQQEVLITNCWPPNLSWFQFIKSLDTRLEGMARVQVKPQKKTHANHMLGRPDLLRAIAGNRQLICDAIEEFTPSDLNHPILSSISNGKWPEDIDPSMPLESTSSNHWGLKMLIYLASNKFLGSRDIDVTWKMIEKAGITQLARFSSTLHIKDTSLAAAMECLFAAGIGAGHTDLVSWLLDAGVNPDKGVKIPHGRYVHLPLTIALEHSYRYPAAQIVRLLLFKGASPVLVCCEHHGSPTQFLLQNFDKHGLSMDYCDEQMRFPLQATVESSDRSCVKPLLGLGASPDYYPSADTGSCSPVLHSAIAKHDLPFDMIEIIESLIQRGAIVQGSPACGKFSHRALMECALSQDYFWTEALVSINFVLKDAGQPLPPSALITTLDLAYQPRSREVRDDGSSPYLCEEYCIDLCEKVSASPPGLFLRSKHGWTALDYAVSLRMRGLETLLVENGVKHTREFAYSQCDTGNLTVEDVEELISRVPAPRSTKQSRDLLFYHLIGTIRATRSSHRDPEHVSNLFRSYRMMPRSPKHDAYIIFKVCLDADLTAMALELLPKAYSSAALGRIIEHETLGLSRLEVIEELLIRRASASLNWKEDIRMMAIVARRALGMQGDASILEWFQKHDRKVLEHVNQHPSAFAIRFFDYWEFGKNWDDFDIASWFHHGLKASSFLGLLIAYSGAVEKMSALLHQGLQPNQRICWSLTALQVAVMRADRPMTLLLIEAGCDVNARPPWQDIPLMIYDSIPWRIRPTLCSHERRTHRRTALQLAVENGDLSIIKLLLEYGADVNGPAARVRGATALQLACINGHIDIVRLLISEGADVNAAGAKYFGRTALEGAAEHGRLDIACFLLAHDCQVAASFRLQYIRAVGFARAQGHYVLSKLLQELGRWTEEDENLLKQTVLRDEWPGSHELEEHLSDDEVSEVDPDECKSRYEIFPYETDDESDLEDCNSVGEEGDATPFIGNYSREATNGSDRFDQFIESAQTEDRPWDEFIDYDAVWVEAF